MDHVLTLVSSTFPGPDRIEIAFKAARDSRAIIDALARAVPGTARYYALCEAMHPRLLVLARIGMSALTDERETMESLQARYEGSA